MDNSINRLQEVFFYGLYMDPQILKSKGVEPRNSRIATAYGYKLRVGKYATLLRDEMSAANGIVYSLTHEEIEKLYAGSGLDMYVAEALMVETKDNSHLAVLCCNLLVPPLEGESNQEYFDKLIICMDKYGVSVKDI